jgi:hypothetical protein
VLSLPQVPAQRAPLSLARAVGCAAAVRGGSFGVGGGWGVAVGSGGLAFATADADVNATAAATADADGSGSGSGNAGAADGSGSVLHVRQVRTLVIRGASPGGVVAAADAVALQWRNSHSQGHSQSQSHSQSQGQSQSQSQPLPEKKGVFSSLRRIVDKAIGRGKRGALELSAGY